MTEPAAVSTTTYGDLLAEIAGDLASHRPGTVAHTRLQAMAQALAEQHFGPRAAQQAELGPFGALLFPFHQMGAVASIDLLQIDELIVFSFYWLHRGHYQRVADIGANIGLHSIILDRCGYSVRAYEPDPLHTAVLRHNVQLNSAHRVEVIQKAVSAVDGTVQFIRVLGNTTGSHIAGSKEHPYGELDRFAVSAESFPSIMSWADLVKLDAEGHERDIILSSTPDDWNTTDAFVEIGGERNAHDIFAHTQALGVRIFSQKIGWNEAQTVADVPVHYREGMAFLSKKSVMPWQT